MEREEYMQLITNIGTCEDEAQRREMLTQLTDEASSIFNLNEQLTQQNTSLSEQINDVQAANMKLFLQVQDQKGGSGGIDKPDPPAEKRKFSDLFDEKGAIK
jgi:hypothetical protein